MEIRVVFESLLARGIEVESLGPFDYMLSSFTNSLKRMPVELRTNGSGG
jgi:hypothetical protein